MPVDKDTAVLRLAYLNNLRFKACMFTLLLVVAMCLFFILLGNGSLQSLLEKNRENRYLNFQYQITGLLGQSRREILQLAELLTLNQVVHAAGSENLQQFFNQQWEYLHTSWGLHSLKLYDSNTGSNSASQIWGAPQGRLSAEQIQQVLLRAQPLEQTYCAHTCVQSIFLPLRTANGDYVLQVERTLLRQLTYFREMTGTEIGILSTTQREPNLAGENYLPEWRREVIALTSKEELMPLLRQVSSQGGNLPGLRVPRAYSFADGQYDVRTMQLDSDAIGGAQFVIIENIVDQVRRIEDSLQLLLLFSVLGAVIFSAAVARMLWQPIVRLRRLAQALPLLTDGQYDAARSLIQPVVKNSAEYDELDVLDNTGLAVCDQLEVMSEIVSRNTAQLQQIATHDSLTGLDNRHSLFERLQLHLNQWNVSDGQGFLFFIDLDDFKQVNDSLGHHCGDEFLRVVSRRLVNAMRSGDIVARLGGDEFCVFVHSLDQPDAYRTLAEKMLNIAAQPVKIAQELVEVTMSIGVVAIPDQGTTLETILQKADMAMYYAKRKGKNNYQLYSRDLPRFDPHLPTQPGRDWQTETQADNEKAILFDPVDQSPAN